MVNRSETARPCSLGDMTQTDKTRLMRCSKSTNIDVGAQNVITIDTKFSRLSLFNSFCCDYTHSSYRYPGT